MNMRIKSMDKRDLIFPDLFYQFISHYDFGPNLINTEQYYLDKYDDYFELTFLDYENDLDFNIGRFLSIDEIHTHLENRNGYSHEDIKKGFIKISTINRGGAIFVDKEDKIIINIWDYDNLYELEENIYSFLSKVKVKPILGADLLDNVKFKDLYKNWGEDFWRVRSL